MFRLVIPGMVCLCLSSVLAAAQESSSPPAPAPDAEESMAEPLPGDHWTYETRDEITGAVKSTATYVVTEVSPKTISVRFNVLGHPNNGYMTFDRSWNLISNGVWRYAPNDGTGVRLPLAAGKTWRFHSNDVNSARGASFRRSGTAKVVGQESITTEAGTFDAFKIQTSVTTRNANDPTKKFHATFQTWYVPAIDHWVKRTYTLHSEGQLRENSSMELVEYGRK